MILLRKRIRKTGSSLPFEEAEKENVSTPNRERKMSA